MKKLSLAVLMLVVLVGLTGCIQMEYGIKINKDNSGEINVKLAQNIDLMGDEGELTTSGVPLIGDIPVEEAEVEEIMYEQGGYTYKGIKANLKIDNIVETLNEGEVTIRDTGRGTRIIEIKEVTEEDTTDEETVDTVEMDMFGDEAELYKMLIASGGKIEYKIEVEQEVVKHNATRVEGNVYIWNILADGAKLKPGEDYSVYLEYKDKTATTGGLQEKETPVEELDRLSKDYYGKKLHEKGILKGTSKGLELDRGLTRVEGAIMYARMLGVEDKLEDKENTTPFNDIPRWATPYINYLYHEGLVKGVNETTYGSSNMMTEADYTTLVLRALGYKEGKDFTWRTAEKSAKNLGLYAKDTVQKAEDVLGGVFNRRKMSYITYNALKQMGSKK